MFSMSMIKKFISESASVKSIMKIHSYLDSRGALVSLYTAAGGLTAGGMSVWYTKRAERSIEENYMKLTKAHLDAFASHLLNMDVKGVGGFDPLVARVKTLWEAKREKDRVLMREERLKDFEAFSKSLVLKLTREEFININKRVKEEEEEIKDSLKKKKKKKNGKAIAESNPVTDPDHADDVSSQVSKA